MLTVTHLGHSGWLCQSENQAILLDPLLKEDFGRGEDGMRMPPLWPPRLFSMNEFPAVDAVVISHEHEDHFNVPSLAMIDRSIPIYLPTRSSGAASTMLREMGFDCRHLFPGRPIRFGSLELSPMSPDFVAQYQSDEWDVLALWIRNLANGGSFFTTVDVSVSEQMIRWLEATNSDEGALFHSAGLMVWTKLQAIRALVSSGERTPLDDDCDALDALRTGKPRKMSPGENVSVSESQVLAFCESAPFLSKPPRSTWGDPPAWRHHPRDANYLPACGRLELSDPDLEILDTGLSELANYMYGGRLFKALYSAPEAAPGLKASFLLLLIADGDHRYYALEYRPSDCSFQAIDTEHPMKEYLSGIECWGTDLVALFRGDFEPRILSLGHSRYWANSPIMPDPFEELIWPFFHPLHRPLQCLNRYREQFQSLGSSQIVISKNARDEATFTDSPLKRMTA